MILNGIILIMSAYFVWPTYNYYSTNKSQLEKLDYKKWMPAQRYSIPGAKWIPNAGLETLTPELRKYFQETVERLTKGNKDAKLVCFCRRGYYSKIAAERLVQMGYTNIFLYPGTDFWEDAGNRLVIVKPEVMRPKK